MCDGRPGPNDKKSSETSIYRALTVTSFHFSLPNIRRINAQIVGVLAFKCVKGLAPSYLSDRFVTKSTVHDCTTRNKDYLNIPGYQSATGQRTFLYSAIKLWNSLPRAKSLLQTACVLLKRNLENYFSNHFLSASFYLS